MSRSRKWSVRGLGAIAGLVALAGGMVPAGSAAASSTARPAAQAEVAAADGARNDRLGSSVALSGSVAVVGAPARNGGQGAAYVFVGSGPAWSQVAELTASDAAPGDGFAASVSISGATVVVGAPGRSAGAGVAYVFQGSGSSWSQVAELTATDAAPGDGLGQSVQATTHTIVAGAPGRAAGAGAAYVFQGTGSVWSQAAELTASNAAPGDGLGRSVQAMTHTIVAGAPGRASGAGAVYVFQGSGSVWSQATELTASDAAAGDGLGGSVQATSHTIVAGAAGRASGAGAAYVFQGSGPTWSQVAELTASDAAPGDGFGGSVSLSGPALAVGASGRGSHRGLVFIFTGSGSAWARTVELAAADRSAGELFGWSVALAGHTALVGSPGRSLRTGAAYLALVPAAAALPTAVGATGDTFGDSVAVAGTTAVVGASGTLGGTGAAYVFTETAGTWSQVAVLTAPDGASGDAFGASVAISGGTIVVGAYLAYGGAGRAYVFTSSPGGWAFTTELQASDTGPGDAFGLSVAVSGTTILAGASSRKQGTGAAYVFTDAAGAWTQAAELTASDGGLDQYFGEGVAIDGTTAVVGAVYGKFQEGAAYVFTASPSGWAQSAELTAPDPSFFALFGYAVAVSGATVAVGSPNKNGGAGEVHVFTASGGVWTVGPTLRSIGIAGGESFGTALAMSGTAIIVGAPGRSSGAGAVDVFQPTGGGWGQTAGLSAPGGAAHDSLGVSVAASGSTVVAGANGRKAGQGAAYTFMG